MDQDMYDSFRGQSYLQDQAGNNQLAMYAPQMYEQVQQNQAIVVAQVNPTNEVRRIILNLKGLRELPGGVLEKWGEPKMNEEGINWVTYVLESFMIQSQTLSHYDEVQISKMIQDIARSVTLALADNVRNFGIKYKTDLDIIHDSIVFNIYAILNRALGQNEKNWLGRISLEHISPQMSLPQPKKEGILSKLRL